MSFDAPKGGTFAYSPPNWVLNQNPLTFSTLNTFVSLGDAPPRMVLCYDSLITPALVEPNAIYRLLAKSVTISDDRNSFDFALRPKARFQDCTRLTDLTEAKALDAHTLRLIFDGTKSDRTFLNITSYPIPAKSFFEANRLDVLQLKEPLGSCPYKVGSVSPG